jgi:uncharacterized protein YgbK (DUF1537 family)
LGTYWNKSNLLQPDLFWPKPKRAIPLLVLSGSCSPVTKRQIEFALTQGFVEMPLEMKAFQCDSGDGFSINVNFDEIVSVLKRNQSVIVHTGNLEQIERSTSAHTLGTTLGSIAKKICAQIKLKRVVIAGGDTSSYAARAMEIEGVEMIAPLIHGAPLCRAYSKDQAIDGLEVNFKGGQVGGEDYFTVLMNGG